MAKKTPPIYLSPSIALDAALAQPRRSHTIFEQAIAQFSDEAVAAALADRLVATDTPADAVERLLPMLMLVELNPEVLTRLADRAIEACGAGEALGPLLVLGMVAAGAIPDPEFVAELTDATRDLLADSLASFEAEMAPLDPDVGENLRQARQVFIDAGAPVDDPMMRMFREIGSRQAPQPADGPPNGDER